MSQVRKSSRRDRSLSSQRGVSVLSVLLGLILGAVVAALAYQQYTQAQSKTKLESVNSEIVAIIGDAQATYGKYGYAGLTTAAAVKGQTIPASRADSATTAKNVYGGAIDLVDNGGTTPNTGLLTYALVPTEHCSSLVSGTESLSRRVQVAGTDVKPLDGALNVVTLTNKCASAAAVSIAWTLGRT